MLKMGFDPAIPATERPQTYASYRTLNGIGFTTFYYPKYFIPLQPKYSSQLSDLNNTVYLSQRSDHSTG